jgi:hypothetical protein
VERRRSPNAAELIREPNIVGALQSNTTLRELRLIHQRTAVSTVVEMALAEMLDKGGARALIRLGMCRSKQRFRY